MIRRLLLPRDADRNPTPEYRALHRQLISKLVAPLGLATLCACSPPPVNPANESTASKPAYSGVYIRRPTLVVRDMEESLSLYRDTLGLVLGDLRADPPDSYVFTTFNIPAGTPVMHATLDSDRGKRVLSLVAVASMPTPEADAGIRTSAILVNANGRLAEIRDQLVGDGYLVLPNHALGETGTEFAFVDRDGHLIALYEFPRP